MVLACQAVNILGVIQPEQPDIHETVTTVSQLIEMSQVLVNSSLQLMLNDESSVPFSCTSDPFADYHSLTKHVNMVDLVFKLKQLIVNQKLATNRTQLTSIDCLEIDNIYRSLMIMRNALARDTNGLIRSKLNCFKNSIFLPYTS